MPALPGRALPVSIAMLLLPGSLLAQVDTSLPHLETRIRTCVAFKDGTVFLVHEGRVEVGPEGAVVTRPIRDAAFGTVGVGCATPGVEIRMIKASAAPEAGERGRTFQAAKDLESGRPVLVSLRRGPPIRGHFLGMRQASTVAGAIGLSEVEADPEDLVLVVRNEKGLLSIAPLSEVVEWRFEDTAIEDRDPERTGQQLRIELSGAREGQEVVLSYSYLHRGLGWVPTYIAERTGDGSVDLQLRAEIENRIQDLERTELYLAVGVPSFAFIDRPSPLVAQASIEQVGRALARQAGQHQALERMVFSNLGNNLVSQAPDAAALEVAPPAGGVELSLPTISSDSADNLHLFRVESVDLARGERALLPLARMELPCRDRVTWTIADVRVETATHTVAPSDRAANPLEHSWVVRAGELPLTTGAVLFMKGSVALGQDRIYYTPAGASGPVSVGKAIGFSGHARESVTGRTEGSKEIDLEQIRVSDRLEWRKRKIRWIDETRRLEVTLRNASPYEADVVVDRQLTGSPEAAPDLAITTLAGATESSDSVHRVTWTRTLAPGESATLEVVYRARIFR